MINFSDSSKTHTVLNKQINASLKTAQDNVSLNVKLKFIAQLREDLKTAFQEDSTVSLDDFNKFVSERYEKQFNKLNRKKVKKTVVRKGPTKMSPYNLFVKMAIPKLKDSFKDIKQNDLMVYSGRIWKSLKESGKQDTVDDKFNFEKYVKDNKLM